MSVAVAPAPLHHRPPCKRTAWPDGEGGDSYEAEDLQVGSDALTQTNVVASTAGRAACAHCGHLIQHVGAFSGWAIRACSNRRCREAYDGAWNLIVRAGDASITIALPRTFARPLSLHLAGEGEVGITALAAGAGAWWRGPDPQQKTPDG